MSKKKLKTILWDKKNRVFLVEGAVSSEIQKSIDQLINAYGIKNKMNLIRLIVLMQYQKAYKFLKRKNKKFFFLTLLVINVLQI